MTHGSLVASEVARLVVIVPAPLAATAASLVAPRREGTDTPRSEPAAESGRAAER